MSLFLFVGGPIHEANCYVTRSGGCNFTILSFRQTHTNSHLHELYLSTLNNAKFEYKIICLAFPYDVAA
jgi:hypothetical protein